MPQRIKNIGFVRGVANMAKRRDCRMNRELIFSVTKNDFEITYFSGKGAGGQHRNKHQNCVRLKHKETGIITTGQSNRGRVANMREAFQGMAKHPVFRRWLYDRMTKQDEAEQKLQERVADMMRPENLLIEYQDDGQWVRWDEAEEKGIKRR